MATSINRSPLGWLGHRLRGLGTAPNNLWRCIHGRCSSTGDIIGITVFTGNRWSGFGIRDIASGWSRACPHFSGHIRDPGAGLTILVHLHPIRWIGTDPLFANRFLGRLSMLALFFNRAFLA